MFTYALSFSYNLLAPHNDGGCYLYDDYYQARGGTAGVGMTIDDMLKIDGSSAGIEGCSTFGVNKLMSSYKEIYDEGKGIFFANMGVRPYMQYTCSLSSFELIKIIYALNIIFPASSQTSIKD